MKIFKILILSILIHFTVLTTFAAGFTEIDEYSSLDEFNSEISSIRNEISDLKNDTTIEEATQIDNVLGEFDQLIDYVNDKVQSGELDQAISTLEFADKVLADIEKSVPKDFEAVKDLEKSGKFSDIQMQDVLEITQNINKTKSMRNQKMALELDSIKEKDFDPLEVAEKIEKSGVEVTSAREISSALQLVNTYAQIQKYSPILGKSPKEINLAIKEVDVIQSADPKKQRAFQIEKFGVAAGLDQKTISKGVEAVLSGDIKAEKNITYEILSKLNDNPNYIVDLPSEEQLDKLMNNNIGQEKAVNQILSSGINFGKGTNNLEVKELSKEVSNTLKSANVDKQTINKVAYELNRTASTVWSSPEEVAAHINAIMSGKEQELALAKLRNETNLGIKRQNLIEQAAEIQATLNNSQDAYIDLKPKSIRETINQINKENPNRFSLPKEFRLDKSSIKDATAVATDAVGGETLKETIDRINKENPNRFSLPKEFRLDKSSINDAAQSASSSVSDAVSEAAATASAVAAEAADTVSEVASEATKNETLKETIERVNKENPCRFCMDPEYTQDPND